MRRITLAAVLPLLAWACSSASSSGNAPSGEESGDSGAPSQQDAGADSQGASKDASSSTDASTQNDAAPQNDSGPPSTAITVRVHYPAGAHKLTIRGSTGPLNWTTGVALTAGGTDTWVYTTSAVTTPLEFKPLIDDTTWSRGPNYKVSPGQTVDVYPHFVTVAGSYSKKWPSFASQVLPSTRGIWVYLPPSYDENPTAKFPVLYMHDGQNLFDASTAFGGNEWKVDETLNAAAEDGSIRETIVIGVENTADRINELTPTYDATTKAGGKADLYLKMITDEIKPMVDAQLRTLSSRDQTYLMGSSLGGLVSAYAGVKRADVFGSIGAMSPSTWWDSTMILGVVATIPQESAKTKLVYVDSGDSGPSNDDVTNTASLAAKYKSVGYVDGSTLKYVVQAGGQHNEVYWAQRLPGALQFLIGPRTP